MPQFTDALRKLDWARERLTEAEQLIARYTSQQVVFYIADTWTLPHIQLSARFIEPLPDSIDRLVSEFANHARSSLDAAVSSLSRLAADDINRRNLAFQIIDPAKASEDIQEKSYRGLTDINAKIIMEAQPKRHLGNKSPIWKLHQLNVKDKHWHIVTANAVATINSGTLLDGKGTPLVIFSPDADFSIEFSPGTGFAFKGIGDGSFSMTGEPIAEIYLHGTNAVSLDIATRITICFDEGCNSVTDLEVIPTLRDMLNSVEKILHSFVR